MYLPMPDILLKRRMSGGAYSPHVLWVIQVFHRKMSYPAPLPLQGKPHGPGLQRALHIMRLRSHKFEALRWILIPREEFPHIKEWRGDTTGAGLVLGVGGEWRGGIVKRRVYTMQKRLYAGIVLIQGFM